MHEGGARFGIARWGEGRDHGFDAGGICPAHRGAQTFDGFGAVGGLHGCYDESHHRCDVARGTSVAEGAQGFAAEVGIGVAGEFQEDGRGGGCAAIAGGADQFELDFRWGGGDAIDHGLVYFFAAEEAEGGTGGGLFGGGAGVRRGSDGGEQGDGGGVAPRGRCLRVRPGARACWNLAARW